MIAIFLCQFLRLEFILVQIDVLIFQIAQFQIIFLAFTLSFLFYDPSGKIVYFRFQQIGKIPFRDFIFFSKDLFFPLYSFIL